MAQYARPSSDGTNNGFATAPLWSKIDDLVNDATADSDYITGDATDNCIINLSSVTDPSDDTNHNWAVRLQATGSGGGERVTLGLYQGAVLIETLIDNSIITRGSFNSYSGTLISASSITDYSALNFKLTCNSGAGENIDWSFAELSIPDAVAAPEEKVSSDSVTITVTESKMVWYNGTANDSATLSVGELAVVDRTVSVPDYRYEIPVTFDSVASGNILQTTITDWSDIVTSLRALSNGDDVRVFKSDDTELARDFSSGVVTWEADNTDATYYIRFGKSDAGTPTTAGLTGSYVLHIATTSSKSLFYTRTESSGFNADVTCEMKTRVATYETSHATFVATPYLQLIENGKCAGQMGPYSDTVIRCAYHNGTSWNYSDVTVSSLSVGYHALRIWYDNSAGAIKYYLDGSLIYTHSGPHYTAQANTTVRFSDGDTGAYGDPEFYIDYVYYDDSAGSGLPHDGSPTNWAVAYDASALPQSSTPVWVRTASDTPTTEEIEAVSATPDAIGTLGTRIVKSQDYDTWRILYNDFGGDTDVKNYGATATSGVEYSQAFNLPSTQNIAKIGLWLKNETDNKPADADYSEWVTIRIETDNAGVPSGTIVGQLRVPYAVIKKNSAGYGEVIFHNLSNCLPTGGSDYHLILSVPKNTSTNSILWQQDSSSPAYAEGVCSRTRAASAWGAWGSRDTSKCFLFKIYTGFQGAPTLPDVSVTANQAPYILPSALPAWAQSPPVYGMNGLLNTGAEKYFAMWSQESTDSDDTMSSFVVRDSDKSVSTTTKMQDGNDTGTDNWQKRVTAYWQDGATYKGVATHKGAGTRSAYRRLHYISAADIMNTAYADGGEITIDTTDPLEHKFATRVAIDSQSYLYFDISPNLTLYTADVVGTAKAVRAKYNDTTALTDFEFIEWDLDGIDGDVAQAWAYKTTFEGEVFYVGFIFAQWAYENYYTGTIYYTKSFDGVVWSPVKQLFTLGPVGTLTALSSSGTNTITVSTSDAALFSVNDYIEIQGNNSNERTQSELKYITNINTGTGVITLDSNLTYSHSLGRRMGSISANQAIAYASDFTDPENAKLWGYASPSYPWIASGGGEIFSSHYPIEYNGDLSQLMGTEKASSESLTITVTESASVEVVPEKTSSDSPTIIVTESASILITNNVSSSDSITIATTETETLAVEISSSDLITITTTESAARENITPVSAESLIITITESATVETIYEKTSSESVIITVVESGEVSLGTPKASSESLTITVIESYSVEKNIDVSSSDSLSITVTETASKSVVVGQVQAAYVVEARTYSYSVAAKNTNYAVPARTFNYEVS